MTLYFITGNKNKFEEARHILGEIEQLDVDLPEIQEIDPREIIRAKLSEALKHKKGEFIVEDTSLYFEALNGLPGPLIKWFLKALDREGLFQLCEKIWNNRAEAKCLLGYTRNENEIQFFEGIIRGQIVKPRGESGFGWDPIFQPTGHDKTFAEMTKDQKNAISHRRMALNKLKEFLEKH